MKERILAAILTGLLGWGAHIEPIWAQAQEAQDTQISDPWEGFNQSMFTLNLKLDEYVLRPVATAYDTVMPNEAQRGVGRFLKNLGVVERVANNVFQGKLPGAGQEAGRFLVNTVLGCAGFIEVAEPVFGLKESPEDFGQTLATYGAGNGPYLVLPFYGPSTVRDAVGLAVDSALNPMNYLLSTTEVIAIKGGLTIANAVNYRSMNLDLFENAERSAVDLYGAVQDGYIQRREQAIKE